MMSILRYLWKHTTIYPENNKDETGTNKRQSDEFIRKIWG